tara:strand:- start:24 stop:209 length:186 start_codon:yes stop_codon:yes gene_type:complete
MEKHKSACSSVSAIHRIAAPDKPFRRIEQQGKFFPSFNFSHLFFKPVFVGLSNNVKVCVGM